MTTPGCLCLVLHAHLPYVRHPEYESFFEESWLFEAITECYLPLVRMGARLLSEGLPIRLTLSLSPTLVAMLRDPFLQERYLAHLDKMRELAARERERTRGDARFHGLAELYATGLEETRRTFADTLDRDLVSAFAALQDKGALEVITSSATHAYLPLLRTEPNAARAQLLTAAKAHEAAFGRPARGLWLPECGYYPGLEDAITEAGFDYFFVDTHGLESATPRPRHGTAMPVVCGERIAAFGRDPDSSRQVWSRDKGYPGDPDYRDFYRDIGFDLEMDYIAPYVLDGHTRIQTGFKYHRITGAGDHKEPYDPVRARERIETHADHFVSERLKALEAAALRGVPFPVVVAPYDAELFGHWWFEGPDWLEAVIRRAERDGLALRTPGDYLDAAEKLPHATPSASSWGEEGYNAFWLNPANDWIYPHLHQAARAMGGLAARPAAEDGLEARAIRQAGRSLLLAQASDWAFVMKTGSSAEYAFSRIRDHLARFHYLKAAIEEGTIDERRLAALETMDNVFPEIDPADFILKAPPTSDNPKENQGSSD